jgi:UPF0176 protein
MEKEFEILLYYHYVWLEDPAQFRDEHKSLCDSLDLRGRIIVAHEGINGTVSGTLENIAKYQDIMRFDHRFEGMPFKVDKHHEHAFPRMSVKVKKELVNLSLNSDINPLEVTGKHLKPKDFYEAMNDDNTIVLDARNDYEYDLGHFKNAIRPDIRNFRDLPAWIKENDALLKNKKILTYCTGGVRCEKFSGWLLEEGYEDVNQLEGGIATYGYDPDTQGKNWNGLMYVFDNRISVPINRHEHIVVGKDYFDGSPCERYVNCANPSCNIQMICSEENEEKYLRGCCDACRRDVRNRYVIEHNLSDEDVAQRLAAL